MDRDNKTAKHLKSMIAGFASAPTGDIWLTVTRASELTGLNPATIREACSDRNGKYRGGCYIFRKLGKPYEILLSSLPESAQLRYLEESLPPKPSDKPSIAHQPQDMQPLNHGEYQAIWETYARKADGIQAEAQRRAAILGEYLELLKSGSPQKQALNILKQRHSGASKATLWRWLQMVEGHPRQYWEALLAPDYMGRARSEIPKIAWEYFCREWLTEAQPDASVIYLETAKMAQLHGWGDLPSLKTFQRRIETDIPENVRILAREGRTALKQKLPHQRRDYTTLAIHELWESDGRKADIFGLWPDGSVGRPFVVIWREVRTRAVLSVRIYHKPNSELIIEALGSALHLTGIIPTGTVIDNGREYANKPLTGGQKTRYRFKVKENEPMGVLTRLGIVVHWATPYHGAAKPIESFWGGLARKVDCRFPKAYTGRNPVERPENCDQRHAIPIADFAGKLIEAIKQYNSTPHSGQGMNGKSPLELYAELMPGCTNPRPLEEHIDACRPLIKRIKLNPQLTFEFKIEGFGKAVYEPPIELDLRRGYEYDILPDIGDPTSPALIYDGARFLGKATYKGYTPFLDKGEGGIATKKRSGAIRRASQHLKTITGERSALPQLPQGGMLPPLPQPDIIKPAREAQPEPPPRYKELSNGDLLDTETGEITTRLKPSLPASLDQDQDELTRMAESQRLKNSPSWLKNISSM